MTTIYKCRNGACKYMEDLRCTLDEIEVNNGGECMSQEGAVVRGYWVTNPRNEEG